MVQNFYSHPDWPGFGKQRQRAQEYVTSDYVLWLDADERVTPKLRESIQQAVQQDVPNTVYDIPRVSEVFGREIRHSGWYPDYVVRLYRTNYAGITILWYMKKYFILRHESTEINWRSGAFHL